tara:strand:- start:3808 stop:6522 length:2715 start_codon:yes stop_codon:yes gene_type:complete
MTGTNRRDFLKISAAVSGGALVTSPSLGDSQPSTAPSTETVSFEVNGRSMTSQRSAKTPLAQVLREDMALTGTKTFCESGACGACTVHLNGEVQSSCNLPLYKVAGQSVTTVEGLKAKELHVVQQAFIDADALQCGFCTPGMVMAAAAFVDDHKEKSPQRMPTLEEIGHAMAGNLCRCGAQPQIIQAIQSCFGPSAPLSADVTPRHDALEKVTGAAEYAFDYYPSGVLHAAVLRATHASAQVKRINLDKAQKMPGVKGVVVHLPKTKSGYARVRWVGQEIAAVAAETLAQAEAAVKAIEVEWVNSKPSVLPSEAKKMLAPPVWSEKEHGDAPNAQEAPGAPAFLFKWEGNVRGPGVFHSEDDYQAAQKTIESAPVQVTFEGQTASQSHIPLEPHGCVVEVKGDELVMVATTQTVKNLASDLAEAFDWDAEKVKVIAPFVGGGFGAKATFRPEHLMATRLALKTKRPVRLFYKLPEHVLLGGNRPGTQHRVEMGADENGQIKNIVHHNESYCGAAVGETASRMSQAHYPMAEVQVLDQNVVTHTPPSCAFRAPGHPPNAFALEQTVQLLASKTGKDPLLLRLENENRPRHRAVYELLRDNAPLLNQPLPPADDPKRFARGVGVATAEWFQMCAPNTKVHVEVLPNNEILISTGSQDMGQGTRTSLAAYAARLLKKPSEQIKVKVGRSDLAMAPGSFGSITTSSIVPALHHALEQYQKASAPKVGQVFVGDRPLDLEGFMFPPSWLNFVAHLSPFAMAKDTPASAQAVALEVDRLLGTVRVLSVDVALDSGTLASPVTAHSQVTGGVIQGLSYALYEERLFHKETGRLLNDNMEDYKILGIADAPEIRVHFYDEPSPNNPVGSLGIGENCTVATLAAVANAFHAATGASATQTPLTPSRVLKYLEG